MKFKCQLTCRFIQALHPIDNFDQVFWLGFFLFQSRGRDPETEWLCEDKGISDLESAFAQHLTRVEEADHHQPILGFLVLDRMPTRDDHTGFARLLCPATDDLT